MAAVNLPGLCVYAKSEVVETTTITHPRTQVRTLTLSVEGFAVATSGLDNTLDAISLEQFCEIPIIRQRRKLLQPWQHVRILSAITHSLHDPIGVVDKVLAHHVRHTQPSGYPGLPLQIARHNTEITCYPRINYWVANHKRRNRRVGIMPMGKLWKREKQGRHKNNWD